jgi:hypothetical protein
MLYNKYEEHTKGEKAKKEIIDALKPHIKRKKV